jgi:hypothetical protein
MLEALKQFVKGEPVALIGLINAGFAVAVLLYPKLPKGTDASVIAVVTALSAFLARAFVTPVVK